MLYLDFISGNNKVTVPINEYSNEKRDMCLEYILYPYIPKVLGIILNNNTSNQTYRIVFREDENIRIEEEYEIYKNNKIVTIFCTYNDNSNLNFEETIQNLLEKVPNYKIIVDEKDIKEVYDGEKLVDLEWFLKEIYYNNDYRPYRKMALYENFFIFKNDIK